jgi:branched-chain amino acid transport system ATP-binding protein
VKPMALLETERVSRRFGSLVAVNGISFVMQAREFCAVIGPNGAGKTTFFNLVSGLIAPSDGRITFCGRDITGMRPERRVAMGIARTFQITEVFPELTLSENLRVAVESACGLRWRPWLGRRASAAVAERVDALIAMGGLRLHAQRVAGELSHGDQRAAEILMTLALRPRLLLLDEPTAGMGEHETLEITELIRRVHAAEGLSTVLIEHDMRVVFHLASRIVVLAEGAVLAEGTPAQIAANDAVQAAYLGSAH